MKSPSSSKATSSVSIEFFAAVKSMVDASSKVAKEKRNRKRRAVEQPEQQQQQDNEESTQHIHFFTPEVNAYSNCRCSAYSNCSSRGVSQVPVSAVVEENRRLCHDIEVARTTRDTMIADQLKKANTETGSFQIFTEDDMALLFEVKKMRQSIVHNTNEESVCDEGDKAAFSAGGIEEATSSGGIEAAAVSSWVSCDDCKKWRRVAQEPTAEKWCCSENPDAKHNTCSVPQELADAAIDRELELSNEDKFLVENVTALFRKLERAVTLTKRQISYRGTTERRPLCALQTSAKYQCYVKSVDCPVEPIDLRKVSIDSDECRLLLMDKLQVLKHLSVSEESQFLAKRIVSAAAGCSKLSRWRQSVTKPAFNAKRRNYSKQLFSIYDSLILMHGITTKVIAAKAEALLAACLTVIYPDFIVNKQACVGYPYDHDDPGIIYWMPVRFEGNITDFHEVRRQIDDALRPDVEQQTCADLGMRFKHIS